MSVAWFHRHFAPVAYRGAVVVSGVDDAVTLESALFFVGGQLRRSRSAQAVSDARKTNRIRLFFMVYRCWLLIRPRLQDKWRVLLRSFLSLHRLFECLVVSFLSLSVSVNSDFASGKGAYVSSQCEVCVGSCVAQNSVT